MRFQSEHDEINPYESAAALLAVRSEMQGQLASARAELSALRRTLQPGAPELLAQRRRVSALQGQINSQNTQLSDDQTGLGAAIAVFEPMMVEKEFAERAYQSALTSLELARIESDRQRLYVVQIASPSVADQPTHPRSGRGILTAFVLSFVVLSIGSLLMASVREHANL